MIERRSRKTGPCAALALSIALGGLTLGAAPAAHAQRVPLDLLGGPARPPSDIGFGSFGLWSPYYPLLPGGGTLQPPPTTVNRPWLAPALPPLSNVTPEAEPVMSRELRLDDPEKRAPGGPAQGPRASWGERLIGLSHVGLFHAGLYTWAYFAWYRGRPQNAELVIRSEGAFGPDTYAGGADKLGHYYSSYAFARLAADYLVYRGWQRGWAASVGAALSLSFFTVIELKDGFHQGFGFSPEDMVANTLGSLTAVLMVLFPELDDLFDLRLYYQPSKLFVEALVRERNVDIAEDYTGSTYLLALRFAGIPWVRRTAWLRRLSYFNLLVGYNARHFLPRPRNPRQPRDRELFVGFSLDLLAILKDRYPRLRRRAPLFRAVGELQEYLQITPVSRLVRVRQFSPPPHTY